MEELHEARASKLNALVSTTSASSVFAGSRGLTSATALFRGSKSGSLPTRVSEEPEEAPPLELADVGVESVDGACGCWPWTRRARGVSVKSSR